MTARVLELDGTYEAALRELDIADSLGVEAEAEAVAARRMILLGKLGRLDDARRIADSLWGASYFGGELFATVPAMTEAYAWATNLYAAVGDFARVRAALAAFSARLAVRLEPVRAYAATVAVLSGSESGSFAHVVLPDGLRLLAAPAVGICLCSPPAAVPSNESPADGRQRAHAQASDHPGACCRSNRAGG